jgi:hemerythrin-like domain-containing protein
MDAFNLLKADHRKVAGLFDELESADGKAKLQVFEQIKTELELHTHIEEKIFYPALEKPRETHDLTLEAYEEHDVVKKLLRQLSRAKTANEEWEAQAKVLRENVEHHVEEEENELFEKAEAALGEEMAAEKERKQGRTATKSSKKSGGAKKSASKTKSASTAAKRARASKTGGSKGTSKSSKSAKGSRSKKSAKKR